MANKKLTEEQKELCRIITPEFRVSYPHLFTPQAPKGSDKLKFSVTMLFPKDVELMGSSPDGKPRKLAAVIKQAKINFFGPKEAWPEHMEPLVYDGDDPKYANKEGHAGHWIIKASTGADQRPSVVDANMKPLTQASDVYPGCYARAFIYAYGWKFSESKQGVLFILDHVQKLRDGKNLGGKKPVEQVFGIIAGAAADDEDGDESFL